MSEIKKGRRPGHTAQRSLTNVRFAVADDEVTEHELENVTALVRDKHRYSGLRRGAEIQQSVATAGEVAALYLRYWTRLTGLLRLAESRVNEDIPKCFVDGVIIEHEGAYSVRRISIAMLVSAVRDLFPPKWSLAGKNGRQLSNRNRVNRQDACRWVYQVDTVEARRHVYHFAVVCELLDVSADEIRFLVYELGKNDPALQPLFAFYAVQGRLRKFLAPKASQP